MSAGFRCGGALFDFQFGPGNLAGLTKGQGGTHGIELVKSIANRGV